MGTFAEPSEIRSMITAPALLNCTDKQLDELYIIPAERMIEERYNLNLNTDDEPTAWAGVFDIRPGKKTKYLADYKRSIYALVNHMGVNANSYRSQGAAGASVTFGANFPPRIDSMMRKWGRATEIYRT